MSKPKEAEHDRWSELTRGQLIALGRATVSERLQQIGFEVHQPLHAGAGPLQIKSPSGRELEIFVSTQRLGGYAFWPKRRLELSGDRFVAIVLLGDEDDPSVYLISTLDWRHAAPPLKDRPNIGKRSAPEFGVSLARSSLAALERYRWESEKVSVQLL